MQTILVLLGSIGAMAAPLARKATKRELPGFFQPLSSSHDVTSIPAALSPRESTGPMTTEEATRRADQYVIDVMKMKPSDFENYNAYTSPEMGITHVYCHQLFAGIPVANAVAHANVDSNGTVLSFHDAFVPEDVMKKAAPVSKRDTMSVEQAVLMFAQSLGLPTNDKLNVTKSKDGKQFIVTGASFSMRPILASKKYYQLHASLVHTWDLNIQMDYAWKNIFVNSATGEVVGTANWTSDLADTTTSSPAALAANTRAVQTEKKTKKQVKQAKQAGNVAATIGAKQNKVAVGGAQAKAAGGGQTGGKENIAPASYQVVPIGKTDPTKGLQVVTSPWDLRASPAGWHNAGKTDLSGNNVIAQANPQNARTNAQLKNLPRPTSPTLKFQFQFNPAQSPRNPANRDTATTNAFYVANAMHDIFYNYGFTEAAGSFQNSNFGKGGAGNDAVIANTQDGSGVNNANFASPPDGQSGIMRMFIFNTVNPNREGALENDVVAHEMAHGLSSRLTGGPANANCLQTLESGGMGEGWSDVFGMLVTLPDANTAATPFVTGVYVTNSARGIRKFPYSTNARTNPLTFASLNKLNEVHNIGEVWANTLFEVMWGMVAISGKTAASKLVSSAGSGTGNTDFALLLIAGMKLQPCNPTFIQARNAIIAADKNMFQGKYSCAIWNSFAKRGMGVNARSNGQPGRAGFTRDNNDLPQGCAKTF
ncbi:Fungalysin metallopeptidase-domain-containing protein [Chytriomyces sp. MP71]|nr:Fungalysin metallopeptidase-domain-containing protein [Chytriomyces sp. MP71]